MDSTILVVGSVALDSVKTPFGQADEVLGGSATYFSVAASFFSQIRVVAVVGTDFSDDHSAMFKRHNIDTDGLVRTDGRTFRWKGEYSYDLNEAQTLDTQLNVFESFKPTIPASYKSSDYVFLGNIDPELQLQVLEQIEQPRVVACDTMNFWIDSKVDELKKTLGRVDILLINDGETRMLAGEANLVRAAHKIMAMGPRILIVKRGEYGVLMFNENSIFGAPAFPLEEVYDPTGAGDSFAGGFMGYLAQAGELTDDVLRRAIIFGSVMASFNVEQFSLDGLSKLSRTDIDTRFGQFKKLTHFEAL
jgi:sugar/nucleoside kinase (ribokinase family)